MIKVIIIILFKCLSTGVSTVGRMSSGVYWIVSGGNVGSSERSVVAGESGRRPWSSRHWPRTLRTIPVAGAA